MTDTCYLHLSKTEDVDVDECPPGLLPSLLDAGVDAWSGWCSCSGWWMPGPAFDAEDVANAWGDHLDGNKRILFVEMSHYE